MAGKAVPQGLKRVCEKWALQIQPRRGDLNLAQDAVLGFVQEEISSPGGTAESVFTRFSRPCETIHLSLPNPGLRPSDCVLGYFQVAPSGLGLQSPVLTHPL